MNDGLRMRVVEVEHVRADAVHQRRVHDVEPLGAAENAGLGGPENGASAAIAISIVWCRHPPSAAPTQFNSVRAASFRTAAGTSAAFAATTYLAKATSDIGWRSGSRGRRRRFARARSENGPRRPSRSRPSRRGERRGDRPGSSVLPYDCAFHHSPRGQDQLNAERRSAHAALLLNGDSTGGERGSERHRIDHHNTSSDPAVTVNATFARGGDPSPRSSRQRVRLRSAEWRRWIRRSRRGSRSPLLTEIGHDLLRLVPEQIPRRVDAVHADVVQRAAAQLRFVRMFPRLHGHRKRGVEELRLADPARLHELDRREVRSLRSAAGRRSSA